MKNIVITDDIKYVGCDDKDIDLFESQYYVPNGISYNSYIIFDDKITIMDTVDKRKSGEWVNNIKKSLNGKEPHYLVVSHMEPDHSYSIKILADMYPNMKIIGNNKTFDFIKQFFNIENLEERKVLVKERDEINLGKHKLQFFMAPMVHWPEVMVTFDKTDNILFTADAFGKFGTLDTDELWDCEARRYYFNIVGKYGAQVQMLLKKVINLDIKIICPLHGQILKDNLEYYINKYNIWSNYEPEDKGIFIAYASIHGNTKNAVTELKKMLKESGIEKIITADLSREDMAECVENAFRYDKLILAASSYNGSVFTPMHRFLIELQERNYQNRKLGLIENGTWAPTAAKSMKEIITSMKNIELYENVVTIKSALNEESISKMQELVNEIISKS